MDIVDINVIGIILEDILDSVMGIKDIITFIKDNIDSTMNIRNKKVIEEFMDILIW